MAKIAEYELWKLVNIFLSITRENFNSRIDPKSTFLWYIFGENELKESISIQNFNLFEQAKSILIKEGSPRELTVGIGYNLERAEIPRIHILLPSESPIQAGIGANEGYEPSEVNVTEGKRYQHYTANSSVTYNLLITSDNMNEVLVIYNWLKSITLSLNGQLELRGLQNCMFGGSDLNIDESLVPSNIFHRNFNLSFTYDYSVPDILGSQTINSLDASGSLI
mgnify:CR=1 FL=1